MAARSALLRAVLAARHTLAIRNTTTTGGGVGGGGLWEARAACARAASTSSASAVSASASAPPPKKQRPAATLHMGTVDVPEGVTVSLDGDILTLTGPLGTSTTSLSRLDGRGDGAVRVGAGGRAIEVASVSKPFYGTLASLLRSKIEVQQGWEWKRGAPRLEGVCARSCGQRRRGRLNRNRPAPAPTDILSQT